jgi:hypothetical protein
MPAKVHVKVEHFKAVANACETEAKTDATTSTTTTTTTNTDFDKENKTPYAPSSILPELDLTDSQVGRSLALLRRALCTHYLPCVQTSFKRSTGPYWTDDEEEEIEDDSSDDWGKSNPADQFKEICGEHPGEGWHHNDPFTIHHYPLEIFNPVNYDRINAPYLTFHIHCDHADISATYGKGYPIITRTLEPVPVDYFCPPLTPEQIEILDLKTGFAGVLTRIIDDHLPLHLSVAIQRYQYYKSIQYKSQKEMQRLKEKEYCYMEKAIGELSGLENTNILGHLIPHETEILHDLAIDRYESSHLLSLLQSYQGPVTMSSLNPHANPFHPDAAQYHLHPEDAPHKVRLDPDLKY